MADEVDTRVSLSFDPGIIEIIPDYDEETRPVLGQTQTALSEAFEALKGIHDAKAAAATNPTLNEYAQLIEVDNYATKRMEKVLKTWGNAVDTLNNNIQSMEKELKAPIEQKAVQSMAAEIRTVFRGMQAGERMTAIRRAIDNDDAITASAVLGARSFISGFEVEEIHDTFVREWQEKQMPLEAKRVRAMRAAADLLNDRVKILKKEWTEAVGTIKITKQVRHGDTTTTKVVREITPAEVREMVRNANLPFAVPVGR